MTRNTKPRVNNVPGVFFAEQNHKKTTQGISNQYNIAMPKQVGMDQSENQQPEDSPVVECHRFYSFLLKPFGKKDNPGTKEDGKDSDELGVGKNMAEDPYGFMNAGKITVCCREKAGSTDHRKTLNIHDQDPPTRQNPAAHQGKQYVRKIA